MMHLTDDFIAEITGLPKERIKFSKEISISNATIKKFLKIEEEEKKLEKNDDFYEQNQIKIIWGNVLSCKEIISPSGPSKRTRKSLRKKVTEAIVGSGISSIDMI